MARRKAAASSVAAVTVYRDGPSAPLGSDNDDDTSHHLPPPRKKTRLSKEPPIVAAAPKTRRAALKEKATNPSSSDNPLLRPVEKQELLHEKLQKVRKKAVPDNETIAVPNLGKCSVSYFYCPLPQQQG